MQPTLNFWSGFLEDFGKPEAEVAFTVLVARHGPMVLGVCRRGAP